LTIVIPFSADPINKMPWKKLFSNRQELFDIDQSLKSYPKLDQNTGTFLIKRFAFTKTFRESIERYHKAKLTVNQFLFKQD
jgi:hypothetical protein